MRPRQPPFANLVGIPRVLRPDKHSVVGHADLEHADRAAVSAFDDTQGPRNGAFVVEQAGRITQANLAAGEKKRAGGNRHHSRHGTDPKEKPTKLHPLLLAQIWSSTRAKFRRP
jgi:hypothetical protein